MSPKICGRFPPNPAPDLKEMYPDLAAGHVYALEVTENAPIIEENVASGASVGQRP